MHDLYIENYGSGADLCDMFEAMPGYDLMPGQRICVEVVRTRCGYEICVARRWKFEHRPARLSDEAAESLAQLLP